MLRERARLIAHLCQLELLAGIEYGLLLKAFEKHFLQFVDSFCVVIREFPAGLIANVLLRHHVVIEI